MAPKQTRPNMVVKTFRVQVAAWEAFVETCEAEGINPSDALREFVIGYPERAS